MFTSRDLFLIIKTNMSSLQARVLYDFDGDTANGELIIREGDIISISRQDVGDGWWEGSLNGGPPGLFPEAYVEAYEDDGVPNYPPPGIEVTPSADTYTTIPSYDCSQVDSGAVNIEWDDNRSSTSETMSTMSQDYEFGARANTMSKTGTIRKSMNRFSNFVKSGGEDFLLGNLPESQATQYDCLVTQEGADGMMWQPQGQPFTLKVTTPEKKSKYKGIKSYIAYSIQPSHLPNYVQHRFKHFDWLYERLVIKFPGISVPPPPPKALTGRYTEDLVSKRRYLLEKWINRVVRHPVLAQSQVFTHFISVCSESREKEWKEGKRRAETDKVVGAQYFTTIHSPPLNFPQHKVEAEVGVFKDFIRNMDESTKKFIEIGEAQWDKVSKSHREQHKRFAGGIQAMATSFTTENSPDSLALTQALEHTAKSFNEISDLCDDQPKHDLANIMETLREYTGLLSTYPEILNIHKGALAKVKECQKLQEDEKLKYAEVATISERMDVVSSSMFAEIQHFHRERCHDFKEAMKTYLQEQVKFQQQIIDKMNSSIAMLDQVPD